MRGGLPRMRPLDEQVLIAPKAPVEEPVVQRRRMPSVQPPARTRKPRRFGPKQGERYYVNEIYGFAIEPGGKAGVGRSSRPLSICLSVVDDAYGKEVARFDSGGSSHAEVRKAAARLCRRLNTDERDWELGRGEYAS